MTLAAGSRLGPYEVLAPLGAGGMGEVWRARDSKLHREVALKVLPDQVARDPERLARFEREAQVLASLNHPPIGAIYGVEETDTVKALVLELVDGPTLADRIARGPIPVAEAIPIVRQIAEALEAAHERGVVHRDLKPANIKLSLDGRVKVLDFGLAKALDPQASTELANSPTLTAMATQHGVILGTAAYMSPEQARGATVDKRADIWAFGCVLYEMLTGRRAFEGDTVSDNLAAVLRSDPDWSALPAATPPALRRLLARCLEKERKKRLHDMGDAQFELDDSVAGAGSSAGVSAPQITARPLLGGRGIGAGVAAAAAALALGGGFLLARWLAPAPPAVRGPVRLVLEAPAGMNFHDVPVISPDGRRLAFVGRDEAGSLKLFVSGIDGSSSPPLAELDASLDPIASRPFWSPDSSAVGFCDGHKLRTATLSGRTLRVIGDCQTSWRGGSWGEDGTVLFAPTSNGPIYAVRAEGGNVETATPFGDQIPDLSHRFPSFLPGGRRFLYLAWSNAAEVPEEAVGLFAGELGGPARKVSDVRSNAGFVGGEREGRLLLLRDRSLVAMAFDPARLTVSGGEVVVDSDIQWFGNGGYGYFSSNASGDLVTLPSQGMQVTTAGFVDRQGTDQGQIAVPAVYEELTVSPDGKRVAAAVTDPKRGVTDIWVMDIARQVSTRLTSGTDSSFAPVWHPAGKTLVFTSEEIGGKAQPQVIAADGSAPARRLAETPHRDELTAFSPDGAWLVLERRDGERIELWARSVADGREVALCQFATGNCAEGTISPDGRALAYSSDFSGRSEVYVRSFLGAGGQLQLSSAGGSAPHWRADGRELVYRDLEGWSVAVEIATAPALEAKPPQRLALFAVDALVVPMPDHSQFLTTGRNAGGAKQARVLLDWR